MDNGPIEGEAGNQSEGEVKPFAKANSDRERIGAVASDWENLRPAWDKQRRQLLLMMVEMIANTTVVISMSYFGLPTKALKVKASFAQRPRPHFSRISNKKFKFRTLKTSTRI